MEVWTTQSRIDKLSFSIEGGLELDDINSPFQCKTFYNGFAPDLRLIGNSSLPKPVIQF